MFYTATIDSYFRMTCWDGNASKGNKLRPDKNVREVCRWWGKG